MIPGVVLLLGVDQHIAQGVSLSVITVTASLGAITHQRQGNVRLGLASWIIPSAIIFALFGAWAAGFIASPLLTRLFGILLLLVGAEMLLGELKCQR